MLHRLVWRAAGELQIVARGSSLERLLNVCARHRIRLYRLRRADMDTLYACISVRDFKRLRWYMGRTGCRVHIVKRHGLPFVWQRLRKRVWLCMGCLLAVALFLVLQNFLWVIDLRVQAGVPEQAVRARLEQLGVYTGAWIYDIDDDLVRLTLMQEFDEIATLSMVRFGNSITIEVYASQSAPDMVDTNAVTGLVASCDGVISEVTVTGGQTVCAVGDVVARGDWLVRGVVQSENGTAFYAHGMGEIYATTWHRQTSIQPSTQLQKVYTGQSCTQYAIILGNWRINLYFGSGITGASCDKIVSKTRLALADTLQLPIYLVKQSYTFYDTVPVTRTPAEATQDMVANAVAQMLEGIEGEVLEQSYHIEEANGAFVLTQNLTCREQIAVEVVDTAPLPVAPTEDTIP